MGQATKRLILWPLPICYSSQSLQQVKQMFGIWVDYEAWLMMEVEVFYLCWLAL
jgi:hypothetical protein